MDQDKNNRQANLMNSGSSEPMSTQHPTIDSSQPDNKTPMTNDHYSPNSYPANDNSQLDTSPVQQSAKPPETPHSFSQMNMEANNHQNHSGGPNQSNIGLMVLQWLTYAFWGWTVLGLSILTVTVISSLISNTDTGGFTPYAIAVVLVLLPIAFVCDSFFIKREPEHKKGGELAITAIHAVIFAIFGVGSLIAAVISLVTMFTSSSSNEGSIISLFSALIVAVFYAATFLRTINPYKLRWFAKAYRFGMLVTVGIIALLAVIGPVAKERSTRDDRLISQNISAIASAISQYERDNDELPENLSQLALRDNAKILVDRNLVEYKKEGKELSTYNYSRDYDSSYYKYQLCVNYKAESSNYNSQYDYSSRDEYTSSPSAYYHPSGDVCYKLRTGY